MDKKIKLVELDLSKYRINHYSQNGEDGVIEQLLKIINVTSGYLVEFGAWNGVYLSNTYFHYRANPNFKTLLLEPDPDRFEELKKYLLDERNPILINKPVELEGENSLNNILKDYGVSDIAVLSIDVDGEDLNIWKTLDKNIYKPAIVVIEFGEWSDEQALNHLEEQFKNDGYTLVCVTGNFIFVRNYFSIKSKDDIHELLRTSGSPEYNLSKGIITHEEFTNKIREIDLDKSFYTNEALPQKIYYEF